MDMFELLISLIDSVAWPLVVLVIAIILRKDLTGLLRSMSKLKYGNLEAEFRAVLDSSVAPAVPRGNEAALLDIRSIAEISPNAAIPYAWSQFERVVIDFISKRQGFRDENIGPRIAPNIQILLEEGVLNESEVELAHRLRRLRNEVTHHMATLEPITTKSALEYAENLERLIYKLKTQLGES
ncbi:MAG: DUF4145 domain-containing protein [Oceanococcus sp.]